MDDYQHNGLCGLLVALALAIGFFCVVLSWLWRLLPFTQCFECGPCWF